MRKKGPAKRRSAIFAARRYLRWGWQVVPVPSQQKAPRRKGWQNLRLRRSEVAEYFDDADNIGILLGEPSRGLLDVDLDCEEAIFLASFFLPHTRRIHGRKSKPASHFWYYGNPIPSPEKFCDTDGTCLVEVRSTGQQTNVPPSIHPSGERLFWKTKGRPGRVTGDELILAVKRLAAATLIARHWPKRGRRHDTTLALAGTLLREGWGEIEVGEFVSLVAQAAADEEWRARKATARTTRKRLDEGGVATGRPRLGELLGTEVVERVCEWLGIGRLPTSPTHVRTTEAEWPEPVGKRAYHGLAGDVVRAIGPITEADEAGLLVQFLISFGNAAGRNARFRVGHAEHHVNLFGVLVGRTAKARKGTSWAEIEYSFESADRVWAGRCLLPGGLASGEGLIWAVRDPTEKKVRPPKGGKQDQDITKTVDEGIEDKRLLVLETEFASPLRIIRREGNILSAVIRRAWDKGNLSNLSKHSPARATGAHISIIGHITREELLREFSAAEGSNGFANRFLWVCVRRSKLLPLGGRLSDKTSRALISRLQQALAFARKAAEMRFTKQARILWCKSYAKLSEEIPGLLGAITSRAEAQVLRLSMIYALLDSTILINRKHLRAAVAVWRYCEASARYVFGDALGEHVADTILRRLRTNRNGLTRTEIREIFSRNRSEGEINNALRVLLEHGLAHCVREDTGGRPSERWSAVR
jgi:hypothetical protein